MSKQSGLNQSLIEGFFDMTKDICKGCQFLNEDLCNLHNDAPISEIKYVLLGTNIDCGCPYRVETNNK